MDSPKYRLASRLLSVCMVMLSDLSVVDHWEPQETGLRTRSILSGQMSNLIARVLLKVDLHRQAEEMAAIIPCLLRNYLLINFAAVTS